MQNMKLILLTIIFALTSSTVLATDFHLSKIEDRDEYIFIQMNYGIEDNLQPFTEILSQVTIDKDKIYIRFLGEFDKETNSELIAYYSKHIPDKLKKALNSSGNLHNPTLEPLISNFEKAFKTTKLFQGIESELKEIGFSISEIEFEKYSLVTEEPPRIWVADIWLKFKKIA